MYFEKYKYEAYLQAENAGGFQDIYFSYKFLYVTSSIHCTYTTYKNGGVG